DTNQPDYAPAKAGDEMTLDAATLTALFADVDVPALVASVVAHFDEATDLPVQTLAALAASETVAALGALISDAAAAKAAAESNQTTLTAVAASAAAAATQATAAATLAGSADSKLTTGRLAKLDGAMQAGADNDTGKTLSDQIDGIGGIGGSGDASESTLLEVKQLVINNGAALAGSPVKTVSSVLDGGIIELRIGDDRRVRSQTALPIPIADPTGAVYAKLTAIGVDNLSFGAARPNHPAGEISGTVAGLAQDLSAKTCIISIEITAAGEGLTPTDDATWQIQQSQTHGTEIDDAIDIEGELHLLPRTVAAKG
ncbi:MAG: hypothetical protein KDA96_16425, partial [Planctomycetaceae bacterium]|nr:hypothetical protein [Planctomycetaceae bacterium]